MENNWSVICEKSIWAKISGMETIDLNKSYTRWWAQTKVLISYIQMSYIERRKTWVQTLIYEIILNWEYVSAQFKIKTFSKCQSIPISYLVVVVSSSFAQLKQLFFNHKKWKQHNLGNLPLEVSMFVIAARCEILKN